LSANLENLTLIGVAATGGGNTLNNIITGNSAANTLSGNAGDDTLAGGGGADVLQGGVGNDTLNGGAGVDNMFGAAGNDSYTVDNSSDVTIETSALDGTDTVFSSVTRTLGANLENLTLTGVAAITGAGNALANIINGNDAANTLFGNDGNDTLNGAVGNDVLQGGAGADAMDGGTGADKMFGGAGNDTYVVDNAGDVTFEGSALDGVDLVQSSVARNLGANLENLTLTGSAAIDGVGNSLANIVNGNSGGNTLYGNGGNDTLNGGADDDTLSGGAGNDAFVFGPGSGLDRVTDFIAGGVDDTLNLSAYSGTGITWTITQVGADTVFDFSNGDQITLTNVVAANLVQTDPFGYS
jgi:Ca2+-binding RTX toxin-like protein